LHAQKPSHFRPKTSQWRWCLGDNKTPRCQCRFSLP